MISIISHHWLPIQTDRETDRAVPGHNVQLETASGSDAVDTLLTTKNQ